MIHIAECRYPEYMRLSPFHTHTCTLTSFISIYSYIERYRYPVTHPLFCQIIFKGM